MSRPLITVFGATGAQGGGLAAAILGDPERRFALRAVTRRPDSPAALALAWAGAEVVAADLDDGPSVRRAMRGAHGAFCTTSAWEHRSPERELRQAQGLARAAKPPFGSARMARTSAPPCAPVAPTTAMIFLSAMSISIR